MSTSNPAPLTCPTCGERLTEFGDTAEATPYCLKCHPRPNSLPNPGPAGGGFTEVWGNLSAMHTWGQLAGWAILCSTTFIPVWVLWATNRVKPNDPLFFPCMAISVVGGTVGMPLLYPKKGSRLPGVIAGPLFGPGVFLAFWLLAGNEMNKLILSGLVVLGGGPSYAVYVILLCRKARHISAAKGGIDGAR